MKRLLFLLLWAASAFAQSTVVSSSGVVDAQGTTWVGGKYQISFVPDPKIPVSQYTWSGGNLQANLFFTGPLIGAGATFSVSIPSNSAILPVGSQWLVKVCPNAASSCYGMTYSVQGATMDLTATLNSVLPPMQITAATLPWAYNSLEMIVPPNPGAVFWNVTTNLLNCWNGSAWTVTCANGGGGGGGTINGSTTGNVGVGTTSVANTLAPVPEINFTTSATTAFACEEDQNRGDWDVRCIRSGVSWSSNTKQALLNTIQASMCYYYTQPNGVFPTVHLPAGTYSIGGNIGLPPNLTLEGAHGGIYGTTVLNTNDTSQQMFTHLSYAQFTCGGTTYNDVSGTEAIKYVLLNGGGSASQNDVGLTLATGSNTFGGTNNSTNSYLYHMGANNFGGPGINIQPGQTAINSRGEYILAYSDLGWYMFGGTYNSGGFTDPNPHCELELGALDSRWDYLETSGYLPSAGGVPDLGYYNRYNLYGACVAGGHVTHSFFQLMPHLLLAGYGGSTALDISEDRFDFSWWEAVVLNDHASVHSNDFTGYCISQTLNPANFAHNPGGITTGPNCSSLTIGSGGGGFVFGSQIGANYVEEANGIWPSWPVWGMFFPANSLGGAVTKVDQPIATLQFETLGGSFGYNNSVNPGADVSQSITDMTIATGTSPPTPGPNLDFKFYKHANLNDSVPTTFSTFSDLYNDTYVTINIGPNDTIVSTVGNIDNVFHTANGANLTNAGFTWWWYIQGYGLFQQAGGAGGGSITGGGTTNTYAIFTAATTIGNGHITESGGQVVVGLPLNVNDGSSVSGYVGLLEGPAPTFTANYDTFYGDSATHWPLFNPNATSSYHVVAVTTAGTPGNCWKVGPTGYDVVDLGSPCGGSLPTYFSATTAGVATASTMQMSLVSGVGRLQAYAANNASAANVTIAGSSADGSTFVSFYWQMHNGTDVTTSLPLIVNASIQPNSTTTAVNCSTSGTVTFAQPFAGSSSKVVRAIEASCVGTATWTYSHSFTSTPYALGPKAADATTIGLNSVTVTGSGSGQLALESIN